MNVRTNNLKTKALRGFFKIFLFIYLFYSETLLSEQNLNVLLIQSHVDLDTYIFSFIFSVSYLYLDTNSFFVSQRICVQTHF